jgi:hypothetical protein
MTDTLTTESKKRKLVLLTEVAADKVERDQKESEGEPHRKKQKNQQELQSDSEAVGSALVAATASVEEKSPTQTRCTMLTVKGESPDLDQTFLLPSGELDTVFAVKYLMDNAKRGRTGAETDRWSTLIDKWRSDGSMQPFGAGQSAGDYLVPPHVMISRVVSNGDDFGSAVEEEEQVE